MVLQLSVFSTLIVVSSDVSESFFVSIRSGRGEGRLICGLLSPGILYASEKNGSALASSEPNESILSRGSRYSPKSCGSNWLSFCAASQSMPLRSMDLSPMSVNHQDSEIMPINSPWELVSCLVSSPIVPIFVFDACACLGDLSSGDSGDVQFEEGWPPLESEDMEGEL